MINFSIHKVRIIIPTQSIIGMDGYFNNNRQFKDTPMKFLYLAMVILVTLFFQPAIAKSQNNNQYISQPHNNSIQTAFVTPKFVQKENIDRSNIIYENQNTIQPNIEIDTVKLEKGRKFIVVSDRNFSSESISGIPVNFESIQKEYITYNKKPEKIIFQAKIEKTERPKFAGKSGKVKLKIEKITIDKITYPVNAVISKIDTKKVYFNTLSSAPIYAANLADTAANGTIHSHLKDPCGNLICTTTNNYTKPLIYLSAAALQAADLLISPFSSLTKTGDEISIPKHTLFEIKLNEDMFVLSL